MHMIVPVIELSSLCFFLHISLARGCVYVCCCKCVCVCVLIYVCVCQCLQRIWKRASGRWRGSCCSWRETWRLSPPLMTPTTCSSPKWLYPLHTHAFTHQSWALFNEFAVINQTEQKLEYYCNWNLYVYI